MFVLVFRLTIFNSCRAKERPDLNITNGRSSLNGGEAGGYAQQHRQMSQFKGYTVDVVLKGEESRTIRGLIGSIVNKDVLLENPVYVNEDGSYEKIGQKSVTLAANDIADLNVIELAKDGNGKGSKKKNRGSKDKEKERETSRTKNKNSNNKSNANTATTGESSGGNFDVKYVDIYSDAPSTNNSMPKKGNKLEEFDFQSNLEKFDKESVFKSISEADKIDQSDRLVSFNKIDDRAKKSGTAKVNNDKYDIDEMVIKKKADTHWDDNNEYDYSKIVKSNTKDGSFADPSAITGSVSSLGSREASNVPFENRKLSLTPTLAQFFSSSFDETPIPTCSTLQLSEIFSLCNSKLGLKDETIFENASRSINDLIINSIIGTFRIGFKNHNEPPHALVIVGNNRAGCIALNTARHLFNRGFKVVVYLLYDAAKSDDDLSPFVDEALKIYSNIGGKIVNNMNMLHSVLSKSETAPLEFIIDGLQGFDNDISDLLERERESAVELINWCNNRNLPIISVDIPTGLNPSSGTIEDDSPIIKSKYVVSVGIPLSSVLNMYKFGYFEKGDVTHFLVDSGIPRRVFSGKSSLRRFDRRWFADSSSVDMRVV